MTDDQFTRLFKRMDDGFTAVDKQFDNTATKEQMNAVYDLLDKNQREHETQAQEQAAMKHQLNRLNRWVKEIADKTGTELRYE
jgi:hypothetical protein